MSSSDLYRRARVSIVLAFATHGAISGSLGPRIPDLKSRAGASTEELGIALMGLALGLFVGTRLAGLPVHRLGSRLTIRVGLPVMGLALIGLGLASDLATLTAAFVGLGISAGLLDVAINTSAVAVERGYARPLMSGIHAWWSVGIVVGSGVGTAAASAGVSAAMQFAVVAAALAASTVWTQAGLLPSDREIEGSVPADAGPDVMELAQASAAVALGVGVVAFGSFLAEGASADWSAVYLRDGLGASAAVAGGAFVAYSTGMTVSRFVSDRLTARMGPVRVIRRAGAIAAAALAVGLAVDRPVAALAMFAVVGAALGPVVPIAFSAAGNTRVRGGGTALGWVVTMGYLGTTVGPVLIGFAAEATDLRTALVIPALFAVLIAALSRNVRAAVGGGGPPAPVSH